MNIMDTHGHFVSPEPNSGCWLWIGEKIGAVMSRVILTIVFVFLLTPVAVLYRMIGSKKKEEKE